MKKKISILGSTGSIGNNLINLILNPRNKEEIEFAKIGVNYIELKDDTHRY